MQFIWNDLITRARVYVDDDHHDNDGYIAPGIWLTFGNVEYAMLRKKWLRMGLTNPTLVDVSFTGPTVLVPGVLATVGVARDYGGGNLRVLAAAQAALGRSPFWQSSTPGEAYYYEAHGDADDLAYTLHPMDAAGTYIIRYIPVIPYAVDATTTIDLPYGGDERLVCGMARRSMVKESASSRLLDGLIAEADAEAAFTASARSSEAPRVRRVARNPLGTSPQPYGFPQAPGLWRWS